ncbi:MAG: type II toxin-antitoxin system HicB family antitoxin [Thauera sp.]|nr:type II toxin-antitoxin system HicB family antitoxin [Thauera sp.]
MLYPIAIEPGDDVHAFGVVVPDIPGCFSAGDTLDEAIGNAREAIELHLEGLAEDDADIPVAGTVAQHQAKPEFAGWIWAVVDVDVTRYMGKAEKINITLPASLIRRIDDFVARHPEYRSRSGFLAQSALDRITHSA